jgi:hypothetical protein
MFSNKKKILNSFVSVLLIMTVLFSSFGFSIYLHKCNSSGQKNLSLIAVENCEHENIHIHPCCSTNKNCLTNKNEIDQKKFQKDCCTFDEENFSLSPVYIANKFQKMIIGTESIRYLSDLISNSKIIDKLELYFNNFQQKIFNPVKNLLKFISFLSNLSNSDKEDSTS